VCQQCEDAIARGPEPLSAQDKAEFKAAAKRKHDAEVAMGRDPRDAVEAQPQRDFGVDPNRTGPAITTNVTTPAGNTIPNVTPPVTPTP
jgi:hypothetical protein